MVDGKRELLRHMLATVTYRGSVALSQAPPDFATFSIHDSTRSPGALLAHIGDLLEGSLYLLQGKLVYLTSTPLPWEEEIRRFFRAVAQLDEFLASDAPLACPIEKLVQGPIGDALTHVGQIVMLRRVAGRPVCVDRYFTADIVPGEVTEESFKKH
jgi:hypothetical protein